MVRKSTKRNCHWCWELKEEFEKKEEGERMRKGEKVIMGHKLCKVKVERGSYYISGTGKQKWCLEHGMGNGKR